MTIYICGAFWNLNQTGTDSKAGTLIHETSHFSVVAGTEDYVYSKVNAKALAINNPNQATYNADNHEYFAENMPHLNMENISESSTVESIPFNTNKSGTWDTQTPSTHRSGKYAKFYTFTLTQRTQVTIDLSSSKDTYLYLLQGNSKNGSKITYNDDGGAGRNARIARTLDAGTYTIEATTYQKATTGAFVLKVSTNKSNNGGIPAISFNTNTNGTWNTQTASTHRSGKYAKFYTFTLTQRTQVTIDLSSSKDSYLYLLQGNSKNGSKITYNDDGGAGRNARIRRTLAAGTYTIEATTYKKATTGAFVLKVSK